MADHQELVKASACDIVDRLNAGEVTPLDLLDALEARIAKVDGAVNALPTLCFDRARNAARELMKRPLGHRGLLAGLPVPMLAVLVRVSCAKSWLEPPRSRTFHDVQPALLSAARSCRKCQPGSSRRGWKMRLRSGIVWPMIMSGNAE